MPKLIQMLQDFEQAHLRAIALLRGVDLADAKPREVAELLATRLAEPALTADGLEILAVDARRALEALQQAGGQQRAHVFFHRFGPIRPLGPGRVDREKPWEHPAGPAEALWYRGFLGRGFRRIGEEMIEVVFLPDEVLSALPPPPPAPALALPPAFPEPNVLPLSNEWAAAYFQLLRAILLERPRPQEMGPREAQDDRMALWLQLSRHVQVIETAGGRLRLAGEPARAWLDQPLAVQQQALWEAWQNETEWNDLRHVPSLRCDPTGWQNDPMGTRQRFLRVFSRWPVGPWQPIPALVAALREAEPDFQRPDGDYRSWYIRDAGSGDLLLGYEQWERVEGALIEYYVRVPLCALGVVELGTSADGTTGLFRMTPSGGCLLAGEPLPAAAAPGGPPLVADESLHLTVLPHASLYYRLQVARFAGPEPDARYAITLRSLLTARSQRIRPPAIRSFLERAGAPLSEAAAQMLQHHWDAAQEVRAHRLVELEFADPAVLEWMRGEPELAGLLGESIGPSRVRLPEAQARPLLDRLRALGLEPNLQRAEDLRG